MARKQIRIWDWRLSQLGLKPMFLIDEHPCHGSPPLLDGVEHANFFETRATEYSKAATRGNWNEVWDNFDRRKLPSSAWWRMKTARAKTCSPGQGWRRSETCPLTK